MSIVTISPKFQVVIPKAIRERLGLRPGQRVEAFAYSDRIELIPVRPITELRRSLPGLETSVTAAMLFVDRILPRTARKRQTPTDSQAGMTGWVALRNPSLFTHVQLSV